MKNQSFYAVVLTLLVLIGVAMWQFFSLVARGETLAPAPVAGSEPRGFERPTLASTPR